MCIRDRPELCTGALDKPQHLGAGLAVKVAGRLVLSLIHIFHKEIRETEQDNVGVESAHKSEEAVETGAYLVREGYLSLIHI